MCFMSTSQAPTQAENMNMTLWKQAVLYSSFLLKILDSRVKLEAYQMMLT